MYMLRANELIMGKIDISTKANTLMIRKRNNNSIKKQNWLVKAKIDSKTSKLIIAKKSMLTTSKLIGAKSKY